VIERLKAARARDGYSRWEARTDGPLLWLSLVFLAVLLAPFLTTLEPWQRTVLAVVSAAIWAVFAVDYAARLYLAGDRSRFVRTHPLDLVVILLPMLRPLRALRLLRLLRAGALLGYAHGHARRSLHARVSAYVGAATVVVIGVSAAAMYDAERRAEDANITTLSGTPCGGPPRPSPPSATAIASRRPPRAARSPWRSCSSGSPSWASSRPPSPPGS